MSSLETKNLDCRFRALVQRVEVPHIADSTGYQGRILDLVRSEIEVVSEQIGRKKPEDRLIGREALARAVKMLIHLDQYIRD